MILSYVTCKNILIFTFKTITLSQDLYWNSKQNIPVTSKMNLWEGNFLKQIWIGLCRVWVTGSVASYLKRSAFESGLRDTALGT